MFIRPRKHLGNKGRSIRSERRAARTFGGKVQPASGAINRLALKGDVKSNHFLVDDKVTGAGSYSIAVKLWRKLASEAWGNNRRPAVRIEFEQGPTLIVLDEATFQDLTEKFTAK